MCRIGKVSLPGLSCHDVTDRVFPYDLGFTVYLRRCYGRYGGKCIVATSDKPGNRQFRGDKLAIFWYTIYKPEMLEKLSFTNELR